MAKYIVTGAAGFIGRNVVAALNARGEDDIILVDRLGDDEKWTNLVGLRFEDFIDIDDFRVRLYEGRMDPAEVVIHEGACSATTETDADYLLDNNYQYSRELCQWCLENGTRFVYASSAATYGDGSTGYSDEDEMTPQYRPLNMYGYSKHMFDLWALKNRLFDRIVGLKYFNVYGPYEDFKGDMRSVVHKAYRQVRADGKVELFKSCIPEYDHGEQVRDFIYIKDAVDVTLHFAENRNTGGLLNCGTGEARTWLDLARAVFSAMDREPNIDFIDMPESLRSRYQYFTKADVRKLRAVGYSTPFTSLEAGIEDYIRGYLAKSQ